MNYRPIVIAVSCILLMANLVRGDGPAPKVKLVSAQFRCKFMDDKKQEISPAHAIVWVWAVNGDRKFPIGQTADGGKIPTVVVSLKGGLKQSPRVILPGKCNVVLENHEGEAIIPIFDTSPPNPVSCAMISAKATQELQFVPTWRPFGIRDLIHPDWKLPQILIPEIPCAGVADEKGVVELRNLPVGKVVLAIWNDEGEFGSSVGTTLVEITPKHPGTVVIDAEFRIGRSQELVKESAAK